MRRSLGLFCAAALLSLAVPASASKYLFTFDGAGLSGRGTLTIDDSSESDNPYLCDGCVSGMGHTITSLSGTINGDAITLAPAGESSGNANLFHTDAPFLDYAGIGFNTASQTYNLFEGSAGDRPGYFLAVGIVVNYDDYFYNPVRFDLTPAAVPEPASWAMLMGGSGWSAARFACVVARRRARPNKGAIRYGSVAHCHTRVTEAP